MNFAYKNMSNTKSKNIDIVLFIILLLSSQPFLYSTEARVAKIGMVSMEATHDFKSTLTTKINAVKPLIVEAGNQNLDLVALPEAYFRGRSHSADAQDLSASRVLDSIKVYAKNNNINIIFNVYEIDGADLYNTAAVVNRDGNYVGKYRKVNLPPEESDITPGDSYHVFDLDFGKVGILICWDGWFTNPAKILVDKGAEIIIIPTWCNIERNMKTITAENGVPVAYAILRVNCGAGDENLPSSVFNHLGDLISTDHPVGQNKIAISQVMLGNYENFALGKTVTSSFVNNDNPAENVVDGKYSTERDAPEEMQTCWIADSLPQWIEIDLGANYDIDRVSIAMFNPENYDYLIEGKKENGEYFVLSDAVTKHETFLEHGVAGSEITTTRFDTSPLKHARFVRIDISSSTKSDIEINEIRVFGYKDSGLTGLDDVRTGNIPTESRLLPNYPNPFNPTTAIGYWLSAVSNVDLSIYNMLGQRVATLVSERQHAGSYTVEWDAGQFSSGVYIAKIEMETTSGILITDSTKLILVR
jgi:predicted amidohydrolase